MLNDDLVDMQISQPISPSTSVWRHANVVFEWAFRKRGYNWGLLRWVSPLEPDTPLIWKYFLQCWHKPSSPFRRKLDQRNWMREKLGRKWRKLVNEARNSTLQDFRAKLVGGKIKMKMPSDGYVNQHADLRRAEAAGEIEIKGNTFTRKMDADPEYVDAAAEIRRRLKMDVEEFWRYCKGTKYVPEERMIDPQLTLFEM